MQNMLDLITDKKIQFIARLIVRKMLTCHKHYTVVHIQIYSYSKLHYFNILSCEFAVYIEWTVLYNNIIPSQTYAVFALSFIMQKHSFWPL